jgi:hypothetical protein
MEKQKIRFINSSYKTLFFVDDGDDVEIEGDSGWMKFKCRYLDEFHAEIGGHVYHICEFAEIRERYVQRYRPAKPQTEGAAKNEIA